jgi:hypothetical protein
LPNVLHGFPFILSGEVISAYLTEDRKWYLLLAGDGDHVPYRTLGILQSRPAASGDFPRVAPAIVVLIGSNSRYSIWPEINL